MKSSRSRTLAASFVVTVAAVPAATMSVGCKKSGVGGVVDGEDTSEGSVYVFRDPAGSCFMNQSMRCPKNVSCNPPPPRAVDCPATHRDAGEPDPSPERPPGKEGWLRTKPSFFAGRYGCSYQPETFCSPPGKPPRCDSWASVSPKCAAIEAGAPDAGASPDASANANANANARTNANAASPTVWRVESFVYKDAMGRCHTVPAFDCPEGQCTTNMPPVTDAPCP